METLLKRDNCHINTNEDDDTFVGIKYENDNFSVCFPLGYRLSENDNDLKKDVLLLISTIATNTKKKESKLSKDSVFDHTTFPFQAYLYLIKDFYNRGYYTEKESNYITAKKGRIDWSRTIKQKKPIIQNGQASYLDFVVRKNEINDNYLITQIHEYCVYDSFVRIGWLFTSAIPQKPNIKFNYRLFKSTVISKMSQTFNDSNRKLFSNMLAIIEQIGGDNNRFDYKYGTYRFEYVWEKMIDKAFGIKEKDFYFPRTSWKINDVKYDNACLEPDSIMLWNGNIFVLDAKYYKYGETGNVKDLPESTSINKQITYGEYIAEEVKFKERHGDKFEVYNAFLMPYNGGDYSGLFKWIGEASSSWKHDKNIYEKVQGILVDVNSLMQLSYRKERAEIAKLAECIESAMS